MNPDTPSKNTQNPHDALFKSMCTDIHITLDLLKSALPPALLSRINLDSLRLTDKSFVSKKLKRRESDLIYEAEIDGSPGYLYFLLEHQSTDDPMMTFRYLEYDVALMRQHLKQNKGKLPIIINICLYHGEKSPYPHSTDLLDCFENPTLAREFLFKPFYLIDLTVLSDDEIEQHGKAALMEFLLKHCRHMEISRHIKKLIALWRRIEDDFYFQNMLYYLTAACGNEDNVDRLLDLLMQELPEQEPTIMTYGEQLLQRGFQQGIQQGIEQGIEQGLEQGLEQGQEEARCAIAKSLLLNDVSIDLIVNTTGLSLERILALKKSLHH